MAEEEIEYESDPEDETMSLKSRRRVASDDEDQAEEGLSRGENPRRRIGESDVESEGAPADYEDELRGAEGGYDVNDECLEEGGVVVYEESGCDEKRGGDLEVAAIEVAGGEEAVGAVTGGLVTKDVDYGDSEMAVGNDNVADGNGVEERKEVEPFSVPTAGAFHMHDDRFRDNAGGRNRRMLGGRRLWESKDDRKWGHDKFEELTMQERHHDERRRGSRGHYRGHGRNRGGSRGYSQQNRPREYLDKNSIQHNNNNHSNNHQNNAAKGMKGRGPQRHQLSTSNEVPATQNKHSGKSVEKRSNSSSGRAIHPVSNAESDMVQPRKQVASGLNISSPPFYPTGSSTIDSSVPLKRDIQANAFHRNGVQSMVDANFTMVQSSGKITSDSIGLDKLNINDSASAMARKSSNTMLMPMSVPSSINSTQSQLRDQGRAPMGQMAHRPVVSSNQINRIPSPSQLQNVQRNSDQSHPQSSEQGYVQQFAQRLHSGPQSYSPPKGAGVTKSGETESTSVSSQANIAVVDKGKGGVQGSGKGSYLYGGHQAMGGSSGPRDQNFPTFLPVMQFGGQHAGGISVPAVGMAFPGYVAKPQLGLGSSEMTWLPILTGPAGALGASYCPPYLSVDGSYNARPSGTAPSTTANSSSQESSTVKVGNEWKPAQKPEFASHGFGQKQKNPRRYTEMKFDQ